MAVGVTQVEAGKPAAYEQFRDLAISKYGKSKPNYIFSAIVLKSCLLAPAGPRVLEGLQPLADIVETRLTSTSPVGIEPLQGAFAAMSMALLEYRQGNFSRAQDWCRRSLAFPDSNDARSTTVHAIGALAARQLGQLELARSELARSQEFAKRTVVPNSLPFPAQGQIYWQDRSIAHVLLKEAENLAP
jgi:hypothetical protein